MTHLKHAIAGELIQKSWLLGLRPGDLWSQEAREPGSPAGRSL